ncbi:MAG: hypothetical protein J6J12_01005 [Oscillospiraceae bacterium]|nr:hypothetical protein [Oscillospiraceae bacterium]
MDILEELWLGNIAPIERAYPQKPEHRQALARVEENRQLLQWALPENAQKILDAYGEAEIQVQDHAERAAFIQGFRLGARLLLAIQKEE